MSEFNKRTLVVLAAASVLVLTMPLLSFLGNTIALTVAIHVGLI